MSWVIFPFSSWPGLTRPSRLSFIGRVIDELDGRLKGGHDELGARNAGLIEQGD